MADSSENTPFLAAYDGEDDSNAGNGQEDEVTANISANKHFRRPIKILTISVSIASLLGMMLLIAAFIIINVINSYYGYSRYYAQTFWICVSDATILMTSASKQR